MAMHCVTSRNNSRRNCDQMALRQPSTTIYNHPQPSTTILALSVTNCTRVRLNHFPTTNKRFLKQMKKYDQLIAARLASRD